MEAMTSEGVCPHKWHTGFHSNLLLLYPCNFKNKTLCFVRRNPLHQIVNRNFLGFFFFFFFTEENAISVFSSPHLYPQAVAPCVTYNHSTRKAENPPRNSNYLLPLLFPGEKQQHIVQFA